MCITAALDSPPPARYNLAMPSQEPLGEFVRWCEEHVTGDEKGQAQIFLDRLFQAFGLGGVFDAGASTEFRIRRDKQDGGGTAFADLVWKPVVLIEMKRRGENLQKHYRQAFDYWTRLVPNRPRYVVLCNFDEFWIYDFETDLDTPKDKLLTKNLAKRWGPLAFLAGQKPSFENDREAVTREAADKLALLFNRLHGRGVERAEAQRFILQMLVALFAEDIGLLEKYFVARLLEDCHTPADSFDLLGGLFEAMNRRGNTGGRFKGVAYFNGGLFAQPARLELQDLELVALREAAKSDWSKVQPEIFGTLFQHSMDAEERHAFGAHFTHPADIMKIVGPTLVEPWREQIEGAKTLTRLNQLADRLHHFRVLDPACGSGNFLYIAYRELKRLEARIYERLDTEFKREAKRADQMRLSFLSAQNFYGLDIQPFAIEIAKVTMMIGRKLAIDELHITEQALPLDNLDRNFLIGDALVDAAGKPAQWPQADVIIGNPPFLGAKRLKPEHGPDYVNTLRKAYPEVPGMADFCVYWVRKAHDHLPPCTQADPLAGRAGLVGTQNIRNNQSRVGGLDHVVKDGTIIEAVDNQPWSGEANVHVSIANWVKSQDDAVLPDHRRLWFKVEPPKGAKKLRKKGSGPASKDYELDVHRTGEIGPSLSDQTDVTSAVRLECNFATQVCFQGQVAGHPGFVLPSKEAAEMIRADKQNRDVIHPFLIGRDLLTGNGTPSEWVIDFQGRSVIEAGAYARPFDRIKSIVLPTREAKVQEGKSSTGKQRSHHVGFLKYWWRQSYDRIEMVTLLNKLERYIVCSDTTKRPVFEFVASDIRPDHKVRVFAFADDYSFGILQSHAHWLWFITKCSKLKSDFNYTSTSVFDTFPWPQFVPSPSAVRRDIVVEPNAKGSSSSVGATSSDAAPDGAQSNSATTPYNDAAPRGAEPSATPEGRREGAPTDTRGGRAPGSNSTVAKINAVAEAGREIRRIRSEALRTLKGGLRALYRTLELPGANPLKTAHAALDAAVLAAYGWSDLVPGAVGRRSRGALIQAPKERSDDSAPSPAGDDQGSAGASPHRAMDDALLARLLALNQSVADRLERGEPVTAPGIPPGFPNPEALITEDCIQPPKLP